MLNYSQISPSICVRFNHIRNICGDLCTNLVEEDLSLTQDLFEFSELQEVAFERLGILIYFTQLIF